MAKPRDISDINKEEMQVAAEEGQTRSTSEDTMAEITDVGDPSKDQIFDDWLSVRDNEDFLFSEQEKKELNELVQIISENDELCKLFLDFHYKKTQQEGLAQTKDQLLEKLERFNLDQNTMQCLEDAQKVDYVERAISGIQIASILTKLQELRQNMDIMMQNDIDYSFDKKATEQLDVEAEKSPSEGPSTSIDDVSIQDGIAAGSDKSRKI